MAEAREPEASRLLTKQLPSLSTLSLLSPRKQTVLRGLEPPVCISPGELVSQTTCPEACYSACFSCKSLYNSFQLPRTICSLILNREAQGSPQGQRARGNRFELGSSCQVQAS